MSDDILSLYAYNRWANDKMLDACRKLSAEQFTAEPVPGWQPVRNTVWHIAIVTEGWLKGVADIADRIHLLDNGAFVWSGEPAVLLERDELLATYLGG